MVCLDAENLPSTFPAILSAKCLESNFPGTNVPCECQFQVLLHLGGFSFFFFLSFLMFHPSGALVMLPGKIAYYSYQLYSDCSNLFVFFIYIFRSEVTPKLYLYQHFNFQTYLFCFILLFVRPKIRAFVPRRKNRATQ